jgi:hypothetical protein
MASFSVPHFCVADFISSLFQLTVDTIRAGMDVQLLRMGRVAAVGTVRDDNTWGGKPVNTATSGKVVVLIKHVLIPGATAPNRPARGSDLAAAWPPLLAGRRLPTLGELLALHPNDPRHFLLLCEVSSLRRNTGNAAAR